MTPEQLAIIATDAHALEPHMEALTRAFSRTLSTRRPDLDALFQPSGADPVGEFADRLQGLLGALGDVETLVERGAALGAQHVRFGVRSTDYAIAGSALLAAVQEVLGQRFSGEQLEAWRQAIRLITESMLQGARPAAAHRRAFASPW
jgi:hemoglobin-like flavoprotein